MTFLKGVDEVCKASNLYSGYFRKLFYVCAVSFRVLDGHCLVRPPCGDNLSSEGILGYLFMDMKIVYGVVSCADYLDIEFADKSLSAKFFFLELLGAFVINFAGGLRFEDFMDIKCPCKLEVGPVVEGVPHGVGDGRGPFLEFLIRSAVAGDIFLRNAVSSHCSPFIMVSAEPNLRKIPELIVVSNHLGDKVAMIIDNRHILRALMVEFACRIALQHEVLSNEFFHIIMMC